MDEGKNFCEQLQYLLNQDSSLKNKRYEVLNAGVSGYSPISEYLYFKRVGVSKIFLKLKTKKLRLFQ